MNNTSFSLSAKAQSLLTYACESDVKFGDVPRGFYTEFEDEGYKPWHPSELNELLDNNLVTLHPDSDSVPSARDMANADEDESFDGVAYLKATESGLTFAKVNGLLD